MISEIDLLLSEAKEKINQATNEQELRELEIFYLGRKNKLNTFAKNISSLSIEDRPVMGQKINQAKQEISNLIELKLAAFESKKMNNLAIDEYLDITKPVTPVQGNKHPISQMIEDLIFHFNNLGFSQVDGPEIESEWYNFTALNLDSNHPAREMQDTFFIQDLSSKDNPDTADQCDNGMVLRTQTSSMQIRYMRENNPPIRIFAPGKVYRKDSDATHSPMFHQVEGLMVDENISLKHLKAVLLTILQKVLNKPDLNIRFRLSYFPFTEPSLELDITFPMKGKDDYWLEVGGAGMVHPNVLKNGKIDPKKFNGFAFGLGIDRLTMIRHNIKDLRLFFENDLRFLKQF